MAALSAGLSLILAKLAAMLAWVGLLIVAVFVAAWEFGCDVFTWVFDQCVSLMASLVGAVDTSSVLGVVQSHSAIPAAFLTYLGALGFGVAFQIVSAALLIRFVLQLIPFTRLGS